MIWAGKATADDSAKGSHLTFLKFGKSKTQFTPLNYIKVFLIDHKLSNLTKDYYKIDYYKYYCKKINNRFGNNVRERLASFR
jgi:hypothetical protein